MPATTASELVDRAKAVSDMRDNFVTPTQWLYWASQERLALDLFLARSGWTLPLTDFEISVTGAEAGVFNVNPTGGIMVVLCVYQYDSAGRFRLLKHNDSVSFLRRAPGYSGNPRGYSTYYRFSWSGDNLVMNLYPEPSAGETYRVVYVPHPKKLVLSSPGAWEETSVAYPMGWEERIVLGMARRALIKEESSTSSVDSEIALWDARIEEACWDRVLSSSPSIRNADQLNYNWTDRYTLPPVGFWTWV
jgi:hypothetical protein